MNLPGKQVYKQPEKKITYGIICFTISSLDCGISINTGPTNGIASGSVGTMRMVGQMLSMGIVLMLFSLFLGKVEINPEHFDDFLQVMKISFIIFTFLCTVGIFASLARGKMEIN